VSAPAPGVFRVGAEFRGIRLRCLTVFQEQQTFFASRHCTDKVFGTLKRGAQLPPNRTSIDRFCKCKIGIVVLQVAGVAPDFSNQAFGREARVLGDRRPHHGPNREMPVMDREKIEHVTWLAAAGGSQNLVGCNVDYMQHMPNTLSRTVGKNRKSLSRNHSSFMPSSWRRTTAL
jgi:hypothetical protein